MSVRPASASTLARSRRFSVWPRVVVEYVAADRQRILEQLPGGVEFADGAAAARKLRIELRHLRRQLRLFAARALHPGLHRVDAAAGVVQLPVGKTQLRRRFELEAGGRVAAHGGEDRRLSVEQRHCFAVVAEPQAQARDDAEDFGAGQRLPCKFAIRADDAVVEQRAHVDGVVARCRARTFKQADDEILQRLRTRGFLHGLLPLPRDDRERRAQHAGHRDARRQRPAMADDVFAQPVADALRAREDRLAGEIALQVERHRLDRGIALLRLLRERLEHDVVEVAGDDARTTAQHRRFALARIGLALQRLRGPRRVASRIAFLPLRVGLALQAVGLGVGQQFVEHDTERIDVGHRRHRLAAHLFRRGVVQRERAHAGARLLGCADVCVDQLGDAKSSRRTSPRA
jgi:hypothetical protein